MFALRYHEFGGPEVLRIEEAPEPHAGPGQVRIAVRAASVNPFDWKTRAGYMAEMVPTTFPAGVGMDAAGVVDEVGEGSDTVAVGDEVFGLGQNACAEFSVLDLYAPKPPSVPFEKAAALGLVVETAARTLDRLEPAPGSTILVDGAAGGVGTALVQLARNRGLHVIGTAREANHDYLRSLGATPTTYGEGLAERASALAPQGVDAAVDVVGAGSVPALIALTGDPRCVATVADFTGYQQGVHVIDTSTGRAGYALSDAARLLADNRFTMPVRTFSLKNGAEAHELSQQGHVRGKLVLSVP
jgi:NADPH:quinone reductase-like Zn-dependent oxidoreductase